PLAGEVAGVGAGGGDRRKADVGVLRDEGDGDHVTVVGGIGGRVAGPLLPVDAPPHQPRLLVEIVADVPVLVRLLGVLDLRGGDLVARLPVEQPEVGVAAGAGGGERVQVHEPV